MELPDARVNQPAIGLTLRDANMFRSVESRLFQPIEGLAGGKTIDPRRSGAGAPQKYQVIDGTADGGGDREFLRRYFQCERAVVPPLDFKIGQFRKQKFGILAKADTERIPHGVAVRAFTIEECPVV